MPDPSGGAGAWIAKLLAAFGGASGITWLVRSLLIARPRVVVAYRAGDGMSSTGSAADRLSVRWGYTVRITNVSKQDALEIQVIRTTNPQLTKLPEHHLAGVKEMVLDLRLVKDLDRAFVADVQPKHDFHGRLEPAELKDLTLVLRYKGESGFTFYTVYRRVNGMDTNMHPLRAPKPA